MPNLASATWEDAEGAVIVVVHNTVAPTDAEWNAYAEQVARTLRQNADAHGLALTDGAAPNARQRATINEVLLKAGARKIHSAVVSQSFTVRAVVGALRLFNPNTAAFAPQDVERAMDFVGARGQRAASIWRTVQRLNATLSPCSRAVALAASRMER